MDEWKQTKTKEKYGQDVFEKKAKYWNAKIIDNLFKDGQKDLFIGGNYHSSSNSLQKLMQEGE